MFLGSFPSQNCMSDTISSILADNNLVRYIIQEKTKTLLKAISMALFFTQIYEEEIQEKCLNILKGLIEVNNLPLRLSLFKNNWKLYEDFKNNASLHGFDKVGGIKKHFLLILY